MKQKKNKQNKTKTIVKTPSPTKFIIRECAIWSTISYKIVEWKSFLCKAYHVVVQVVKLKPKLQFTWSLNKNWLEMCSNSSINLSYYLWKGALVDSSYVVQSISTTQPLPWHCYSLLNMYNNPKMSIFFFSNMGPISLTKNLK